MATYSTWWYSRWEKLTTLVSSIEWTKFRSIVRGGKNGYDLTEADHELIKQRLASGYYIILTKRETHLTTYFISLMSLVKTGKPSEYTHALMNLDLVENPDSFEKFKLMEATSKGVHLSSFLNVFDCDSVCLLQPKNVKEDHWDEIMAGLAQQMGKKYDNLFNINDDTYVSCVEMVLDALRFSPQYWDAFPHLEEMIKNVGNLTPQMYRDCSDFSVVLEIKR
jgi:hypothetical protein